MKRRLLSLLLLCAVCAVSCQKESFTAPNIDGSQTISISATTSISTAQTSASTANTRIGFTDNTDGTSEGTISLAWENNGDNVDTFSVYDNISGQYQGDFKYIGTDGAKSGVFEQVEYFAMTNGDQYTAVIPAVSATEGVYPTLSQRNATSTTATQVIESIGELSNLNGMVRMMSEFTYLEEGTSIAFDHEIGILKLGLTMPTDVIASTVKVMDGAYTYSVTLPTTLEANETTLFIGVEPNGENEKREISLNVSDTAQVPYTYAVTATAPFEAGMVYPLSVTLTEGNMEGVVDYYTEGIEIDGETYNAYNATLITEAGTLSASGIYFLDPESADDTFTLAAGTYSDLVLIGRYSYTKPKVACSGIQYFGAGTGVIYKNIDFTVNSDNNYTFNFSSGSTSSPLKAWIVEDCTITTGEDKTLSYFNVGTSSIEKIVWRNNTIKVVTTADNIGANIIYLNNSVATDIESIDFSNNLIYSASGYYINGALVYINSSSDTDFTLTFKNNTLIDYISTNAILYVPNATSIDVDKNIFWGEADITSNFNLIRCTYASADPTISLGNNVAYGLSSSNYWRQYNGSTTYPTTGNSSSFAKSATDPFEVFDRAAGVFTPYATYDGYGAAIE